MTPYQLKKSILLKGVKGELVDQIASEGTGRDVLTKSSEIREKIIKTEKLKSPKEIKAIDESTEFYFDIPDTWEWERFGNLVINYDSKRKPVAKELRKTEKGTYDYYGATGAIDKVDEYIFDGEYLMIGEDGGNFFVDRDNSFVANGQFWANNHVHVVKPALCDIFFLKYFLDCLNLPGLGLINGIAVPKLNQGNLNSILVPVPPLEEQHRIVAKIEEILPYVDRYAKAYEKLEKLNVKFPEDMKKSILQYAIQGKLVEQRLEEGTAEELYQQIQEEKQKLLNEGKIKKEKKLEDISDFDIPFDIPDSWKWIKVGELSSKVTDGEHKTPHRVKKFCGYYLLSARNVLNGSIRLDDVDYVDEEEYKRISMRCNPQEGDILLSCSGSVGRCTYIRDKNKYVMVRSAAMISPILIDSKYLMYAIQSECVQMQIREKTKQTAQANLFQAAIINLVIPVPPVKEQRRIVDKIEELLPFCEKL